MSLPTLKDLGLEDKRKKIPDEIKKAIKEELDNGVTNMAHLSRKYNVSVFTVRMVRDYKHERAMMKKSLDKKGGYKAYYKKEKHAQSMKNVFKRKEERIKELVEFYNKNKGDEYVKEK